MSRFVRLLLLMMTVAFSTLTGAVRASEPITIDDLAWLAGCWRGPAGEECWLEPAGGSMVGVNRGPGGGSFELLRIESSEDGLTYLAQPGGRCPATPFPLTESRDGRAVFANPDHDFPQRIEYWLDADGGLNARVTGPGSGGEDQGFELHWEPSDWSRPQP